MAYEGEIWCLCTATFCQKVPKLNSRPVFTKKGHFQKGHLQKSYIQTGYLPQGKFPKRPLPKKATFKRLLTIKVISKKAIYIKSHAHVTKGHSFCYMCLFKSKQPYWKWPFLTSAVSVDIRRNSFHSILFLDTWYIKE